MKKHLLTGTVCFVLGAVIGFQVAQKTPETKPAKELTAQLSSQGRAEMQRISLELDRLQDQTAEVMAEKTRMLQAITAQKPDRNAADFYLAGMVEKTNKISADFNKALLDAIERMPLIDRRAFMEFYLKNKDQIKQRSLILPLVAASGLENAESTSPSGVSDEQS